MALWLAGWVLWGAGGGGRKEEAEGVPRGAPHPPWTRTITKRKSAAPIHTPIKRKARRLGVLVDSRIVTITLQV